VPESCAIVAWWCRFLFGGYRASEYGCIRMEGALLSVSGLLLPPYVAEVVLPAKVSLIGDRCDELTTVTCIVCNRNGSVRIRYYEQSSVPKGSHHVGSMVKHGMTRQRPSRLSYSMC